MNGFRWIFRALFRRHTTLAKQTLMIALACGIYATVVVVVDQKFIGEIPNIKPQLHVMLGTVLGIFLAFRTSTAYDRWWEGRKLWGQLVNDSRNLAIKVQTLPKVSCDQKEEIGRLLIVFSRSLKDHLRATPKPKEREWLAGRAHVPLDTARSIRANIVRWREQGWIDGYDDIVLDIHARALMDISGGCERIRKTPLAQSYMHFIRQGIGLYLVTLPWGLVDEWRYWSIAATALVSYFMIGIELLAESVEEPFGHDEDDLRLDEICDGIEASIREVLAER
ncbi:MAG: bestrophin family protein [Gemmataceae bacterium]